MARIVVAGYMIRHPIAGNMFAYFHYLLGLHRLGHEVSYVEESGWPDSCYNPLTREYGDDPTVGISLVRAMFERFELRSEILFVEREGRHIHGGDSHSLERTFEQADLLLNLGGVNWLPEFQRATSLAYVDMDPVFTQSGRFGMDAIRNHDAHFTYGRNIGTVGSQLAGDGIQWTGTVPPVVSDIWEQDDQTSAPAVLHRGLALSSRYTTIANWSAYGEVTVGDEQLGQKDVEFMRLADMPRRSDQKLEIAIAGADDSVRTHLTQLGWGIRDAAQISLVPDYRDYIRSSRGEFSVAKEAYVATRSGWFSDRSVCYLASGRPVVLQDTGFTDWLDTGDGVVAFSDAETALAALNDVDDRYEEHRAAAVQIASEVFSYDIVLPKLLGRFQIG